jgi:putative NADPH-quinone reductase
MTPRRILIINGHPDARPERLCAALAGAYAAGARAAGHEVQGLSVGDIPVAMLEDAADFATPPTEPAILEARETIAWADHLMLVFPLWLGATPAKLKAFLEQVFRAGFGFSLAGGQLSHGLKGKSLRVVVTMGMPGALFRLVFGAHGLLSLEQGVFGLTGVSPVRHTILGGVEAVGADRRRRWLALMQRYGREAR